MSGVEIQVFSSNHGSVDSNLASPVENPLSQECGKSKSFTIHRIHDVWYFFYIWLICIVYVYVDISYTDTLGKQ